MRKLLWMGSALAALVIAAAPALAGCGCGSCCEAAPCQQIVLRVEASQRVETVQVPVVPAPVVRRTEGTRVVPVTRCVPVCVTDPCTGCTRTEYKHETVMEQVKTLTIEVLPPAGPCVPRTEERIRSCVSVTIDRLPAAPCAH